MSAKDRAFAALLAGQADAAALFALARAENPTDAAVYLGEAEALFAAGDLEPWRNLDSVLTNQPGWVEGQKLRAALRWECGAGSAFDEGMRQAIATNRNDGALWNAWIALLAEMGDHVAAADAAEAAYGQFGVPILRLMEASHAGNAGQVERAEKLLAGLPASMPDRAPVEVRHLIRTGRYAEAEGLLEPLRTYAPGDLTHWALSDIVWRLQGDPRAEWLSGQPGLIAAVETGLGDEQLAELAEVLRRLHRQRAQPLGQSVRGGTQTRGPLFERAEPEIRSLHRLLQGAVDAYRAALPPHDPGHPLLRYKDRAITATGGWSVRLAGAGFHVAHLHPAGLLSSAFYVAVPKLNSQAREGWLEIGAAPADLCVDLPPRAEVEPRPGRLALFPSFLYHGTRPFASGERLTVAFDAA